MPPIPASMSDLSTTAASNYPTGSDSPTSGDDYFRAIQAIIRSTNAKGADIASASSIDLGAATGEFVDVTGTTTITSLGTVAAGIVRTVRFTGALTLTHNGTSLQLPGNANITTANGDVAQFRSLGSGNWKCVSYMKADGTPVVSYTIPDGDKGDITTSASGATWTIDNDAVTYAKMQNISATSRILGRKTAAAGDTEECTLSEVLDFIGSAAQGDILYRGASAWARLPAGTSGNFLKTQGEGANPTWDAVTGGATLLGTLTTTSGTTQTLSTLTLTSYTKLFVVVNGVSFTSNVFITINSNQVSAPLGTTFTDALYGFIDIDLTSSIGIGLIQSSTPPLSSALLGTAGRIFNSGLTTASTSITFAGGTFDAGTIKVYGVR